MSTMSHQPAEESTGKQVFLRTATGTRLHLPECPHVYGTDPHVASAAEQLAHPVCDWSTAQLEGHGRDHFDTIEDAMRHVGVPVENHDAILRAMAFVPKDDIYVVHSLTYGALGFGGRTVAGFGKTFYWVGDKRVDLPNYVATARAGHDVMGAYGYPCPSCFLALPLTGVCDDCG